MGNKISQGLVAIRVRVGAREDARADAPGGAQGAALGVPAMISSHHRRCLADGQKRVALRPIRTKPKLTARCVPRAPRREVSTIEGAR